MQGNCLFTPQDGSVALPTAQQIQQYEHKIDVTRLPVEFSQWVQETFLFVLERYICVLIFVQIWPSTVKLWPLPVFWRNINLRRALRASPFDLASRSSQYSITTV